MSVAEFVRTSVGKHSRVNLLLCHPELLVGLAQQLHGALLRVLVTARKGCSILFVQPPILVDQSLTVLPFRIVLLPLAVPLPAIAPLPILITVVAVPLPAFSLSVPVSLPPLKPLIAVGAFPLPAIALPVPLSLLSLIPLVFFGSEQAGR
jgi:hypothetical protein